MNHVLFSLTVAAVLSFAVSTDRVSAQNAQIEGDAASLSVSPEQIARLVETMQIDAVLVVMRQEGLNYGKTLEEDMFGGNAGADWPASLDLIYDASALRARIEAVMLREYAQDPDGLDAAVAFFGSSQGQRILGLEVEARRTMLDDAAKEAAELGAQMMVKDNDPRMDLLRRFAEANDLLEMNVAGAMTSNLSFYKGMASAGAFGNELTEEQMLSDVWNQEPDVRKESEKWLYSFLSLAYQPLSDADLEAYIAFSETPAGQRLNSVLFAAFDEAFRQVSYELGRAAAKQMQGQDI